MDKRIYELHADICKTLGHPLRIMIIDLLQEKELRLTDMLPLTGGAKSNLSQHLSLMASSGILNMRREGQSVYFSLASPKVAMACVLMREVLLESLQRQKEILEQKSTL